MTKTILLSAILAFLILAGPARAANDNFGFGPSGGQSSASQAGMCAGQSAVTEKDLQKALAVMAEIIEMGGRLSPADEETIVRGRGLTSARLNCILGKIMAGNDIFGWGSPEAYGVGLTEDERAIIKKYRNESEGLKTYLEDTLNIKVEN